MIRRMEPRALAIDFGTKRVGIAVSDSLGIAATPVEVIEGRTPDQVADRVAFLAKDRGVAVLVVGMPANMDGSVHKSAASVRQRAEQCAKKCGLPVEYVDERLTTMEAERHLREAGQTRAWRKERIDRVAAALILQSWLTSRRAARARTEAGIPPGPEET
ncbi:MAG: putative pre-16S rRNA nuclease [Planctomycetes bacterium]|nr:putative pre-16S rRNA nuclease [Planctomycetota bacterium]